MNLPKNIIGLEGQGSNEIAAKLNHLLADFQIHYQNLRAIHWNVKGKDFFQLHIKFEEYYTEAQLNIDEVAERILTLGEVPLHTFSDYIANSSIPVAKEIFDGEDCVHVALTGFQSLIAVERNLLELASEYADEGTADIITPMVSTHEKHVWMLNAWLGKPKG